MSRSFYKRPWFLGVAAALGVLGAVGSSIPIWQYFVAQHDTYVRLQATVESHDGQLKILWPDITAIYQKLPPGHHPQQ